MSGRFAEHWYRLFLRAFPRAHRTQYGDEIVGTLLTGTARRVPSPRETAGLLMAGFAARVRAATTVPWWADGLLSRPGVPKLGLAGPVRRARVRCRGPRGRAVWRPEPLPVRHGRR